MKAARIHKKGGDYCIDDVSIPEIIHPTDIIIRIAAASLCHTDFMVRDGAFGDNFPITGSHEAVGTVHDLGDQVKTFTRGERIGTLTFQNVCGKCPDCKAGRVVYCDRMSGMSGITVDGGFAGFMRCDSRFCVRIPDAIPFTQAAPLMCAGATIWGALKKCELQSRDVVGIIGLGGLGHIGIQLAIAALDVQVVAVDTRDEPIKLAKSLKYPPTLTINPNQTTAQDAMKQISKLKREVDYPGLDAVIIATDSIPAFSYAANILKKHGLLVVVGQPSEPVPITFHQLIFRNIKVIGSLLSDPIETQEMVDLIAEKGIEITVREYDLDQINEMMQDSHKPDMKGRSVIRMTEDRSKI